MKSIDHRLTTLIQWHHNRQSILNIGQFIRGFYNFKATRTTIWQIRKSTRDNHTIPTTSIRIIDANTRTCRTSNATIKRHLNTFIYKTGNRRIRIINQPGICSNFSITRHSHSRRTKLITITSTFHTSSISTSTRFYNNKITIKLWINGYLNLHI